MAQLERRLQTNAAGDFYVDDSCIDCATCRWMAPEVYDAADGASRVHTQPQTPEATARALRALVACPTASIGTIDPHPMGPVLDSFPVPILAGVSHCGYHAESSFGAASYFIERPDGNVLVDSPRFAEPLARRLEALGGVALMVLSHRDDVADHEKWHARFGCERVLHEADVNASTRSVERKVTGLEPVALADDLLFIPTPGHTRGSACLLFQDQVLFSGDHLAYNSSWGHLYAFRGACWYDWDTLAESMERLSAHRFEAVLPGHGWPLVTTAEEMAAQMQRCLAWIAEQS